MVIAPTTSPDPGLGVLGIRAEEHPAGLLTSGNTRQAGYVLLTDLAPSIAAMVGADLDDGGIEGRPVESRPGHGSADARRDALVTGEEAALFRDRMLDPVVLTLVVAVSVLALAAAAAFSLRWDWLVPIVERVALLLLVFPTMTYLAALLPFHDWGSARLLVLPRGHVRRGRRARPAAAAAIVARASGLRLRPAGGGGDRKRGAPRIAAAAVDGVRRLADRRRSLHGHQQRHLRPVRRRRASSWPA